MHPAGPALATKNSLALELTGSHFKLEGFAVEGFTSGFEDQCHCIGYRMLVAMCWS